MEGTGVALKVSLSGKIYKRFSFVLEEDIRPRDDFREAGWFLTTGEINYRILPNLRVGAGYMSLVRYKASEELRNRYYLYASGSHRFGTFKIAVRERFQSTYKKNGLHPTNYLRSMFTLSYRIASSGFEPFIYVEPFNNVGYNGKMRADKIRYSAGCDYRMDPKPHPALLSLPYLQCIRSDQLPSWHRPDLFSPVLIQAGRHLSTKRKETYRYAFMRKPFYRPKALFY